MTEMMMPSGGRDGEAGVWSSGGGGCWEGVEVTITIAAKHLASGLDILNRETKSAKFYGTVVITGKLSNREQVTDE